MSGSREYNRIKVGYLNPDWMDTPGVSNDSLLLVACLCACVCVVFAVGLCACGHVACAHVWSLPMGISCPVPCGLSACDYFN